MKTGLIRALIVCCAVCLGAHRAAAQLEIPWYTIDCGGGTSSGGTFVLQGTVGQPDAGVMSGGTFQLSGGYWVGGGTPTGCDSIDFNNDTLFPDTLDLDDFISVFAGGPCSNDPNCGDIDFNNDGLFPDTLDVDALLSVFAGGPCLV